MGLWHKYAWVAYLAVFLGVCGHASSEFVSVLSGVKGPELSVWRFLLGGAGLVILALIMPSSRNLLEPFKREGLRLVWLSILGVSLGYLLFHWSLDFATVSQVATMVTTIPIFVGLANLWVNRQPFGTPKIISGVCAMLGVALLITDGYLAKLAGEARNLVGVFMAVGCAAVVSLYTVMVRPIIGRYGALRITAITMFMGAVGLWLVVGVFWGIWVNPATLFARAGGQVAALLTLSLYNTTITQFLWIGGLAAVPDITRGSYIFFLKPVIAAFLAVVFLGQGLTVWQVVAMVVICASVGAEAYQALRGERA
ncbi:MAG: EamA family transporter [Deltaproteobacteria bacterium]|nr:EamA family transporter [Deltaproteobacteria bacterium]MBW1922907.1 EamA family transporter [Deltaproteobacteria bacterium]MBW1949235.1 EamA family transporter [Deltaproteobacteria bacterium]MBW2006884.1 EamA family transporter [Deltaproteobacteria bacterium]MBW2103771.1 EamA family transporter [Deltaproteobacteria bacterium]